MNNPADRIVVLKPGEGRSYSMPSINATFKIDATESPKCSVSEWWLDPHSKGPSPHSHLEDDMYYVIEGTVHFFIHDQWHELTKGSFILIPGGIVHDFENRSDHRMGLLNLSTPGDFEKNMPMVVDWFKNNPPGRA